MALVRCSSGEMFQFVFLTGGVPQQMHSHGATQVQRQQKVYEALGGVMPGNPISCGFFALAHSQLVIDASILNTKASHPRAVARDSHA